MLTLQLGLGRFARNGVSPGFPDQPPDGRKEDQPAQWRDRGYPEKDQRSRESGHDRQEKESRPPNIAPPRGS